MFTLTHEEFENLKSQIATSSWGGRRKLPNAFTEHGVLMLSSILNSKQAIQVNIQIMRIYTKIREMLLAHKDVFLRVEQVEKQMIKQDYFDKVPAFLSRLKDTSSMQCSTKALTMAIPPLVSRGSFHHFQLLARSGSNC